MNTLPLPPLNIVDTPEGPTFFVDNSRMEAFFRCAKRGEFAILRRKKPSGTDMALEFGSCMHTMLQYRYRYLGTDRIPEDELYRINTIPDLHYKDLEWRELDEYRTASFAKQVFMAYNNAYPTEDWKIIQHKGKPLVELSFAVYLGTINGIRLVWIGRLDLGVEDTQGIWVLDHKTTKMGGDYFAYDFHNSSQLKGYTYALSRIFQAPIRGAIVNALICRKPTKTGKGIEFQRFKFTYTEETLEEWRVNLLHAVSDFFYHHQRGYYPMHTTQCVTKYGKCPFLDVCQSSPDGREGWLNSGAFTTDIFDPRKPERVNLETIRNTPTPDDFKLKLSVTTSEPSKNVDSIIQDILSTNL